MLVPNEVEVPIQTEIPRATRLALEGHLPDLAASIWVGGAWADFGSPVELEHVQTAQVIDCADILPDTYREASGNWLRFVFDDLDAVPAQVDRLVAIARESAERLRAAADDSDAGLYVFCQYGMNRSTLVAGLVLRHLGMDGAEAVRLLQKHRPGALANDAFRRLLEELDLPE